MGFHSQDNLKYGEASINRALASGMITQDDADLIRAYASEYQATRHVSNLRILKSIFELVNWRRFIHEPYREVTITQLHKALNELGTANTSRGQVHFKANTKHDYVKGLKWFLQWMIGEGHSKLSKEKVDKIKVPPVDSCTTTSDCILQEDDILTMVTQARTFRDKALLFVLYESGCRIGELARIKWKDVVFNDDSTVSLTLTDTKTRKTRHALLGASVEYLAGWRNKNPGTPDNEAFVFISANGDPMEYRATSQIISRTAKKAGVEKRVTPHLFRKSRKITSLIKQNYQESVIKQAMWGNLGTNMFKTYVVLSEQDIDAEFRERMGIQKKEIKEDKKMVPQCKSCFAMNGPKSNFCHVCGKPLTGEVQKKVTNYRAQVQKLLSENPIAAAALVEAMMGLKPDTTE